MRIFVTGASGWIGSAVVPELIGAGHQVTGLARSDASAAALAKAGAQVRRGSLDDLDVLREAAADSDGVINLAFRHDLSFSGNAPAAAEADCRAVEAMGEALAGSGGPLVIASTLPPRPGQVITEQDGRETGTAQGGTPERQDTARLALALAGRDVRSAVVRLPPTVHGEGDPWFMASLVGVARDKAASGYVGDGSNRWPAVHRLDAARLFRLAAEQAPAGSVLHAAADEGVPLRDIAEVIGQHLDVPVIAVPAGGTEQHFGWLSAFVATDCPASSALTRELVGWQPAEPGLLDDLREGHYFRTPPA
jgi:nucleoside-diphosphate-sugar epimerase